MLELPYKISRTSDQHECVTIRHLVVSPAERQWNSGVSNQLSIYINVNRGLTSCRGKSETKGSYPPGVSALLDVVIRGYDRLQVDRLLDRLSREMSILRAERDATSARANRATEDLAAARAEAAALRQSAQESEHSLTSVGMRISKMLELAKQEADDIARMAREEARGQADIIRRLALEEQARARAEVESTTRECAAIRAEAHAQARQVIEDAHEGVRRELEKREEASRLEARNRIRQAQAQSDNMLAAAEDRVADIEAQWLEVHTWLAQFRETMSGVPAIRSTPATSLSSPITSSRRQLLPGADADADSITFDQPSYELEDAEPDRSVLGREDILAYRHSSRRRAR